MATRGFSAAIVATCALSAGVACRQGSNVQPLSQRAKPSAPHTWKHATDGETGTVTSRDGKLKVTVYDDSAHRAWWYASQVRLSYSDPNVPDVVYSWGADGPGSIWYPLLNRIFGRGEGPYQILGWTAEGIGRPILHAWTVTIAGDSMKVQKLSFRGGRRGRLFVAPFGGRLGLFLPGPDADGPGYPCRANVYGKDLTDRQLRAGAKPAPQRIGSWYTRGRFMDLDPGAGSIYWVAPSDAPAHEGDKRGQTTFLD